MPFGSEGNRIELTIKDKGSETIRAFDVRMVSPPDWLNVTPETIDLSDQESGAHRLATFTFSIDDSAPTEDPHDLNFEVYGDGELVAIKQISIVVELPEELSLRGNYPNPFNSSTTIGFVMPEDGDLAIEVFDGLGRLVDRLEKRGVKSGRQTIAWDAGKRSSGVYFYRVQLLTSEGTQDTKLEKMLVVK